jgi:transcriptional regulator with GAF, ATPase, and Fis domain
MLARVTSPKSKAPRVKAARADGRAKSALTIAGDQAKLDAERALLASTLDAHGWNLTHTAKALRLNDPSSVLRAIERCGLKAAYAAHRISAIKA